MKKITYLLGITTMFLLITIIGCKKDEALEQAENTVFTPRIFKETLLFPNTTQILNIGQNLNFAGIQYSPADKVKISWKINDKEVSTDGNYLFSATEGGDLRIKLDVSYEGITVSRYTDVFVIPNTYTPKAYTNVMLTYLSDNASAANVDWTSVTHVAYKVASVTATGTVDVSKGEVGRKAEELVGRAHLKGVPVLLGISGALSGDGWAVSGSNNFGAVLTDATKRAALIQTLKAYIIAKKMDGIDVMMTDINATTAIINANTAATGPFLTELRAALGATSIITVTVTTNTYHSKYPDLSAATWINVHAFEDGVTVGPGITIGQSSGYDYFVAGANIWKAKYPASKLVMGIPAFGLRYLELDANGKNKSWTSYNYIPYKDILAAVPTAANDEYTGAIAKGVYYNGIPLVTQKGTFIKQNGFLGAYVWAGDYDVIGANSLTTAIYNKIK